MICQLSNLAFTFSASQDISTRIMSFSGNGTRGLCVLSANGTVSKVTLRHASTSGGTVVTYEVIV